MVGRKSEIEKLIYYISCLSKKKGGKKVLISALAFERGNGMRKDLGGEQGDDAYSFSPFFLLLFFPFFFSLSCKLTWKTGIYRPSVGNREETAFPIDG